jgi:hypothetical protein
MILLASLPNLLKNAKNKHVIKAAVFSSQRYYYSNVNDSLLKWQLDDKKRKY